MNIYLASGYGPDVGKTSDFMCRCGYSLRLQCREGKWRVICSRFGSKVFRIDDKAAFRPHDDPTEWVDIQEEARQLYGVIKALQKP